MCKAILRLVEGQPVLAFKGRVFKAAIGESGLTSHKAEGDHCTPIAALPLRQIYYRADRVPVPVGAPNLPVTPIGMDDGWCDDASDLQYNRPVPLPYPASCERMWREDRAYDICVVLGWNDFSPIPGRGSAIFLHVTPERGVTEGCIGLSVDDLRAVLAEGLEEIVVEAV